MSWKKAIRVDEVEIGNVRAVTIDEDRLVICRLDNNEFYAIEDLCSHDDGPLGEGALVHNHIECPRHGARFDVKTGKVVRMPAAAPLETFATRIDEGWVEVDVE